MLNLALHFASLCAVLALLPPLVRLWRGPRRVDRVLAADTLYTVLLALVVLAAIRDGAPFHLEVVVVLAAFGFLGTAAAARMLAARGGDAP